MSRRLLLGVTIVTLAVGGGLGAQVRPVATTAPSGLAPTAHPPLPRDGDLFWIVPDGTPVGVGPGRLARGARLLEDGDAAGALALLRSADVTGTPLAGYAQYYIALALLELNRPEEARTALVAARSLGEGGALDEVVPLQLAELAAEQQDARTALGLLDELSRRPISSPQVVFLRLGAAAEQAGERERALAAYRRVYYEYPLSGEAEEARRAIAMLAPGPVAGPELIARELARAERLFAARRWADARAAFAPLAIAVAGSERSRVELRVAACDFYLKRHAAARDALRSYVSAPGPFQAEARYIYLSATRALGRRDEYVAQARALVADHPDSEWAEETLNNLASHFIQVDDDAEADRVFRELYRRFPRGRYAERAAWKAGWWSYRQKEFTAAAGRFEEAAAAFPRADNRPAWLYWAGRARDQAGEPATANARYRLAVADYQNSYYGRMAARLLTARREALPLPTVAFTGSSPAKPIPTEVLIRALGAAELYGDALREVRYAQAVWGDSTILQATTAWLRHHQGLAKTAQERFDGLRGAITLMRRTYPQFLASGGEQLPADVLRIIYPLDYWPLIKSYSDRHGLDPFLVSALMAQESTFTAEIRSSANAYGLMQIIPSTGRRYARVLGVRPFSTASLTTPEVNVRIGTKYFKDLLDRFGGAHYALAGYNAGEHRVARWLEEAPGLAADEFVDNIPFPETQAYVKRILGTAEDYRRLYGPGGPFAPEDPLPPTRRAD
jgi:soluble lytic murein transglycosylase